MISAYLVLMLTQFNPPAWAFRGDTMRDSFFRITAIDHVLDREGGYVDHPSDPGGETKYGISKRAYPDLDIKNLTRKQARSIYAQDYWMRIRGNDLPPPVAAIVMDYAVNSGVDRAVRLLQAQVGATVDGVVGPYTISAAHAVYTQHGAAFLRWYSEKRLAFLEGLDTYRIFGKAWRIRVLDTYGVAVVWHHGINNMRRGNV